MTDKTLARAARAYAEAEGDLPTEAGLRAALAALEAENARMETHRNDLADALTNARVEIGALKARSQGLEAENARLREAARGMGRRGR